MKKLLAIGILALGMMFLLGGGIDGTLKPKSDPTIGGLQIDVQSSPIKVQDFGNKASFELSIGARNIVWDPDEPLKPKILLGDEGDGAHMPVASFSDIFGMDGGGLKPKASYQMDISNKASFLQIIDGGSSETLKPKKISFKDIIGNYPEDVEGIIIGGGFKPTKISFLGSEGEGGLKPRIQPVDQGLRIYL